MKKIIGLIIALFVCSPSAMADSNDSRTTIHLSAQHRALVVAEMQQFLSGLQRITDALSKEDMDTVAAAARALGTSMSQHIPADLKRALPQGFREKGHAVHSSFDQIALDAESLGDGNHTLSQLAQTLSGCMACHSMYQIRVD